MNYSRKMELEMDSYIEDNKDELLEDIKIGTIDEISLKHFTTFINAEHSSDTIEGFKTKDSAKIIKKFVKNDFNSMMLLMKQSIAELYDQYHNQDEMYEIKRTQLKALQAIKTFEQRSPEWYEFRKKILTASDLATAFDRGHFNSREDLILGKIDPQPWLGNQATEWGVKYEDAAIQVYEQRNNVKVLEFGLVPHPTIGVFGASPDGIVADTGNKELTSRMLEIKCPWMRKIKHGEVPWHYWAQIQGQLDSCDLDFCDFIQVKIVEYSNRSKYLADTEEKDKGLIISTWNKGQDHVGSPKYHYCAPKLTAEEEDKWLEPFFNEELYEIDDITHWKVQLYSCFTVKRDRAWFNAIVPEIYRFSEDLNYWREQGADALKTYIKEHNKKKPEFSFKGYGKGGGGGGEQKLPEVCLLD